jgi:PAS domain-containing protein
MVSPFDRAGMAERLLKGLVVIGKWLDGSMVEWRRSEYSIGYQEIPVCFIHFPGTLYKRLRQLRRRNVATEHWDGLNAIFEPAPFAIGISQNGKIVRVNEKYRRMFFLGPEQDVRDHELTDHLAPECREESISLRLRGTRGEQVPSECVTTGFRTDGLLESRPLHPRCWI